jgi:RNA polymerase nonessential primary-like sigma factor
MEDINYSKLPYSEHILSKDEQLRLIVKYRSSKEEDKKDVLLRLIGCNWKLVYTIARKFKSIDIDTAMSVGFIGLIKAIDHIDLSRGNGLTTVAYPWIRMEITRTVNREIYSVPVPEYVFDIVSKKIKNVCSCSNKDKDLDGSNILDNDCTYSDLSMYFAYTQKKVLIPSLNNEYDDSNTMSYYEPIADAKSIKELEENLDVSKAVNSIKDDRIRDIIIRYYGINGYDEETLGKLGKKYNVTTERIRQLIGKGLILLRKYMKRGI